MEEESYLKTKADILYKNDDLSEYPIHKRHKWCRNCGEKARIRRRDNSEPAEHKNYVHCKCEICGEFWKYEEENHVSDDAILGNWRGFLELSIRD